jgi:hypothetical protein
MTGPCARILNTIGTYWAPLGETDDFGQPMLDQPQLVNSHWLNEEQFVRSPQGDDVNCHTVVYIDIDVDLEGYLAEGDYSYLADPRNLGEDGPQWWGQIKLFSSTPDLRNLERERRAHLT